jgi:hypothetical protein
MSDEMINVIALVFLLLFNFFIGGLATQYSIQYWVSYFKHSQIEIGYFPSAIAGTVIAETTIPIAILTLILDNFGVIENKYYDQIKESQKREKISNEIEGVYNG